MLHNLPIVLAWVTAHKDAILYILGGSAGISVFAQGLLHKIDKKWKINSKPFSYTLVQVLTLAAALSAYLVNNTSFATAYPWLAVAVASIHRYMVSPYYTNKILPFLEYEAAQANKAQLPDQPLVPAQSVEAQAVAPAAFVS